MWPHTRLHEHCSKSCTGTNSLNSLNDLLTHRALDTKPHTQPKKAQGLGWALPYGDRSRSSYACPTPPAPCPPSGGFQLLRRPTKPLFLHQLPPPPPTFPEPPCNCFATPWAMCGPIGAHTRDHVQCDLRRPGPRCALFCLLPFSTNFPAASSRLHGELHNPRRSGQLSHHTFPGH